MFVEELAEIRKCEDKADEIKKQSKADARKKIEDEAKHQTWKTVVLLCHLTNALCLKQHLNHKK